MASTAGTDTAPPAGVGRSVEEASLGESRWPPVAAVLVFMGLNIGARLWLPPENLVGLPWLMPALELLLLVILLAHDPGSRARSPRWLRRVALTLVGLLVVAALWATAVLIYDLITGAKVTESPGPAPRCGEPRLARQQPRVRAPLLADGQRRPDRAGPAPGSRSTSRSRSR